MSFMYVRFGVLRRRFAATALMMCLVVAGMADTLTLQQGQDGYIGCTDSYICSGGYSWNRTVNFGGSDTLLVQSEQYQSG